MGKHFIASLALLTAAGFIRAQPAPILPPPAQHASSARAVFNPYPVISPSPNNPLAYKTPPISPYLNILRGGDPATNYYLNVVPLLQQLKKENDPTIAGPRIDPKIDEDLRDIAITTRRSTSGNLSSFGNYYGNYALPNQRAYVPYTPQTGPRPPVGP